MTQPQPGRIEQLAILHQVGVRVVLVHGAGPQSTALATRRGLETRMVEGRRVTDAETLQVSADANAELSAQIQAVCDELGIPATSVRGADKGLIKARRRPPVEVAGAGRVD